MNCCDGNCNQGRDCPIRTTWVGKEILPVSTWRHKVKCLVYWMLMIDFDYSKAIEAKLKEKNT